MVVVMAELVTYLLKLPRESTTSPEAAQTFLSALVDINYVGFWSKILRGTNKPLALEIAHFDGKVGFLITLDEGLSPFVQTQIQSTYPSVVIEKIKDPIKEAELEVVGLKLTKGNYHPIATYNSFDEVDPMSSILTVLAKCDAEEIAIVQFAIESIGTSWQRRGQKMVEAGIKDKEGNRSALPDEGLIKEKINYPGFGVSVRIGAHTRKTMEELKSAFGVFSRADSNSFAVRKVNILKKDTTAADLPRRRVSESVILNTLELATVWHLPSEKIKTPSIAWGRKVLSEPPDNLPVALGASEEEKKQINFFGRTVYKNQEVVFGIKDKDRRRHIWNIGKTGTGKSTMIANMAIDDFKKGRGVCVIDPHGDTCETLLDYIPSSRINDTVYFNPADREFPININPLEVTNREDAELVVSGLMAIFTKVWEGVWSARMEYILRNSFMTMAEVPNSTLEDVLKILANQSYRNRVLEKTTDQTLIHFWKQEFDKMPPSLQKEAIAPIQNKVGQFVTSPLVRRIIGQPKSSIQIDEIMNEGKILLCNLSQGRLGEDNAALLGAMLITKFQLGAMHRVEMPEEQRKDYFLYVDEFQNFATSSFLKILSEARKYRLSLMLANQYMAQLPPEVVGAILGNAGTLVSFAVGATDAAVIHKEYSEVFSEADLVNLENFQIATKLMVDGHSTRPFLAYTLPLPASRNQNRDKVLRVSRERWARKTKAEANGKEQLTSSE